MAFGRAGSSRSKILKPVLGLCFCAACWACWEASPAVAFAKTILVTGAGGRTGSLVVAELLDAWWASVLYVIR